MQGIIALDIDGTITASHRVMPKKVVSFLGSLVHEGWSIIFITGRTFRWGYEVLQVLPFSYYLAVQNGAIILELPSRKIISKKYLDRSILQAMNEICRQEPSDFVIYGGFEHGDACYYRPERFASPLLKYLKQRIEAFKEIWSPVESFDDLKIKEFPSVKCFGDRISAERLANKIEQTLGLHVPIIRDPFDVNYYVVQATHSQITKGQALQDFIKLTGKRGVVVAAGDDYNDMTMLENADIKIAMATAPKELIEIADIIAPAAEHEGIIEGLQAALKKYRS